MLQGIKIEIEARVYIKILLFVKEDSKIVIFEKKTVFTKLTINSGCDFKLYYLLVHCSSHFCVLTSFLFDHHLKYQQDFQIPFK